MESLTSKWKSVGLRIQKKLKPAILFGDEIGILGLVRRDLEDRVVVKVMIVNKSVAGTQSINDAEYLVGNMYICRVGFKGPGRE